MAGITTLTRKGQITIPKDVREELGLKPFDKIEVVAEGREAKLRKASLSLDDLVGILPPLGIPVEDMLATAWDDWVDEFMAKNR